MLKILKSAINPINPSSKFPPLASHLSNSPILQGRQRDHSCGEGDALNRDPDEPPRLFVVQPRIRPESRLKSKLEEALNLANSLEQQRDGFYATEFLDKEVPPHLVVQNPLTKTPRAEVKGIDEENVDGEEPMETDDSYTFFGVGTVSTIKCHINNLESKDGVDAIFVNAILSGIQQRNLERQWGKPVLDRVSLIIEIFNAHAQTKEAKLQADLAALMYKKSRLVRVSGPGGRLTFGVGEAEVVSARGRGGGGQGFMSGAGETELQLQRRRISDRKKKLLSEIKEVRRTRAVQRAARKSQGGSSGQDMATVAIVGYTNAGKSTLVSALSNTDLYCDDRLFATVDPKLRAVVLPSGREVLLSDTVGFISDLPVQLVEAFHATLEEVVEADLLVHVLDSSAPDRDEHREAVLQVLGRIGVSDEKLRNMIEVWNKVDLEENKFDVAEEVDDGDYASSLSGKEDGDAECELTSGINENDQGIEAEPSEKVEENICDEQVDEGWLSCEEEDTLWFNNDGSSTGSETVGGQQNEDQGDTAKGAQFQSESTEGDIKTSAVTGIGLRELLELIDNKLGGGTCQVVERKNNVYDKKWRPPHKEDDKE